jgi:hypothetical protein
LNFVLKVSFENFFPPSFIQNSIHSENNEFKAFTTDNMGILRSETFLAQLACSLNCERKNERGREETIAIWLLKCIAGCIQEKFSFVSCNFE